MLDILDILVLLKDLISSDILDNLELTDARPVPVRYARCLLPDDPDFCYKL